MGRRINWAGPVAMEGELTGDARLIEPGALTWETPIDFRTVIVDEGEHKNAINSGRCTMLTRQDDGVIWGEGWLDLDSEIGVETERLLREEVQTGISLDLDETSYEVRVAQELMDEMEAMFTDEEGDIEARQKSEDGYVTVMKINADDEITALTGARVRAATLVSIPAFINARITLDGEAYDYEPTPEVEPAAEEGALVASAGRPPVAPPAAWFSNPRLEGPTPLVVTDAGQVYGHLATWDSCHIGHSEKGICVPPPHSFTDYDHFLTGYVVTEEGDQVPVGRLTMGTGHADTKRRLSVQQVLAHYDNTGTAAADIFAGEDQWGIWIAGALRPSMTPEKVRDLRSSPLSGDWRRVGRALNLELVAALAVNVPGYTVLRPKGMIVSGKQESLVAAGVVDPFAADRLIDLTEGDLRMLKRAADRERVAMARKVKAFALRRRAGLA